MTEQDSEPPYVVEAVVDDISYEDGGCAAVAEINDWAEGDGDDGWFVRVQSWSEDGTNHALVESLRGRRVRVTIEVLPEPS